MFEAVRRPRNGLEPLLLDRRAVHDASTKSALVYAPQRVPHLLQHGRIELDFRELLALALVNDARVGRIARLIRRLRARILARARGPVRNVLVEVQRAASVLFRVHSGLLSSLPLFAQ